MVNQLILIVSILSKKLTDNTFGEILRRSRFEFSILEVATLYKFTKSIIF